MRVAKGTPQRNFNEFISPTLGVFLAGVPSPVRLRTPLCGAEQSIQEKCVGRMRLIFRTYLLPFPSHR